jgi:type VI secretion system protein ImpL
VPALYSRVAFKAVNGGELPELVKRFRDERWVWGEGGPDTTDSAKLEREVSAVYEEDYVRAWDAILNDVELVPLRTVQDTITALDILSGATSPLRNFLQTVVDNTSFVSAPSPAAEPRTVVDKLANGAGKAKDAVTEELSTLFPGQAPRLAASPGGLISAHFQPIHRLLQGAQGMTPLDAILAQLRQLEQQLRALGPEEAGSEIAALSSPAIRGEFRQLKQEVGALPPGPGSFITRIVNALEGGVRDDLLRQYREQVGGRCGELLAGRYPFALDSQRDVGMRDFSEFFGYGGRFDKFFNDHLQKMVDTGTTPWKWRPGMVGPDGLLVSFEAAQRVREAFFQAGQARPDLKFTLTMTVLDSAATRLLVETDGQRFEFRRNDRPVANGVWPGPAPSSSTVTFDDRSGGVPGPREDGPWGWFRLIDGSQPQPESDTKSALTLTAPNHHARLVVEATGGLNPFMKRDWQRFSCSY